MGEPAGAAIVRRVAVPLAVAILTANLVGAIVVFAFLAWVVPLPPIPDELNARLTNAVALVAGLAVAVPLGFLWSVRRVAPAVRWLRADRLPDAAEQLATLRAPLRLLTVQATLWGVACVAFVVLNLQYASRLAVAVGITVALGGAVTCALSYLLAERIGRPVTERALAGSVPDDPALPGVAARLLLAWGLGTGAPVFGLALVGGAEMVGVSEASGDRLAATIVFLGATALVVGLAGMTLAARSVADPVERVRRAMSEVGEGRTDVEVAVSDGSEVGLLQAGFNRMVAGLREREELRDMFGRQVGEDVARQALERGVELGGEEREVAVLFIDLVGSTQLAAECPPAEVVALLNEFFGAVVAAVSEHGGSINKFEGDAALCLFGAPLDRDDAAGDALAAARSLRARLCDTLPQADFGIGVSAGAAVAGNIGAAERFEYTVIGDPVNEAARLTELAKEDEGGVLASGAALERAREGERGCWSEGETVTLRGRSRETRLARPRREDG
jgi:adenylate cyclase